MASVAICRTLDVSGSKHLRASDLHYPSVMPADEPSTPVEDSRDMFARVIREAREHRGWNQDRLAEEAGVSRPTIQRWEQAKTGTPDPENARRVFLALGLDPRRIPVILGYVTAKEMDLPDESPRAFTATTEEIIAILEDPAVPAAVKEEWVGYLRYRAQQATADGKARRQVS